MIYIQYEYIAKHKITNCHALEM